MGQVDEATSRLEFDNGNGGNGKYKVEEIRDRAIYAKELEESHLSGLYYLVSWKRYPKQKNTWEPVSAIQLFWRLVITYHKNYPDKSTATSPPMNTAPPMAGPIVKPEAFITK